jgi:phosphatidate cytidylyltransferase
MSELIKRTLSGTLFVACVVGSIIWNPFAFSGLFFLFCIMAVDEFHRLVKSPRALRVFSFVATVVVWMTMQLLAWKGEDGGQYRSVSFIIAMSYLPIVVIALLDEIWNHSGKPLQNWGNFLISQVMIVMPLATLLLLNFLSKWLLLALFVLIWVNDTGAYCVGSLTAKRKNGNHKMTPHISPKKSWEGLIGGFVFTLGAAVLLHRFGWFDEIIIPRIQWLIVLGFAFLVSAFGTMGDLMESLFKRSLGVKDSGAFLPGHGGVLDRFDSVLLASPIITAFCYICYFLLPLV